MNKKKIQSDGIMYSTNPNFKLDQNPKSADHILQANQQDLRIHLDRLGGGKLLTRIVGFIGNEKEIEKIGRTLKQKCGVGGTVKEGVIFIQGDHREKILLLLAKAGYRAKKAGG